VLLLPDHERGGGLLYWSRAAPKRQGSAREQCSVGTSTSTSTASRRP
jgi:hypothetical protein